MIIQSFDFLVFYRKSKYKVALSGIFCIILPFRIYDLVFQIYSCIVLNILYHFTF